MESAAEGMTDVAEQRNIREFDSLGYVKLVKYTLSFLGLWPFEAFGDRIPLYVRIVRMSVPAHTIVLLVGQIHYIKVYCKDKDIFFMAQIYITITLTVVTTVRSCLSHIKDYGNVSRTFFYDFHLIQHRHKSKVYEEFYIKIDKLSKYFSQGMMSMMFFAALFYNVTPTYNNYVEGVFESFRNNATKEFSINLSFPGLQQSHYFYTFSILNIYFSYVLGVVLCSLDLYLILMVFQIMGHLLILKKNLHNLSIFEHDDVDTTTMERKKKKDNFLNNLYQQKFTPEENAIVKTNLAQCIEHHKEIVTFTNTMSTLFGPLLAFTYMFHLVGCCLLLLQCSQMSVEQIFRYLGLTTVVFGELIVLSVTFEFVGTLSENLIDALYEVSWDKMDISNQKTVCIFLNRIQTPIQVMALGVTAVGVRTMAGILKTTFSYFTFLRSIAE